jgi:hypothetical protein
MTYISEGDISITLSGGAENSSPDISLGGEPSSYPIVSKRLFPDVSIEQATNGIEEYKCIYINNNSFEATLYEAIIFTEYTAESDVTIELGFIEINERQTITVDGFQNITGGSFSILYIDYEGQQELEIDWNSSASIWAGNLQAKLRTLPRLINVEVSAVVSEGKIIFEINFKDYSGKRFHELLKKTSSDLTVSGSSPSDGNISIRRDVSGSPINSEAQEIERSTTPPYGVIFNSYESRSNAYSIAEIRPGDVIPVWIKRTVPADAKGLENDGVNIRIEGRALPPT